MPLKIRSEHIFGFAPQPDLKDSVTKVVNSTRV